MNNKYSIPVVLTIAFLAVTTTFAAPAPPDEDCSVEPRDDWSEQESWVWNRVCMGEHADLNNYCDEPVKGWAILAGADVDMCLNADEKFRLYCNSDLSAVEEGIQERICDEASTLHSFCELQQVPTMSLVNRVRSRMCAGGLSLRSEFLETILLHEPWRSAIPRNGVQISATFDDELNLERADLESITLVLDNSHFTSDVRLQRIHSKRTLSMTDARFDGTLDLADAEINGDVFLQGTFVQGDLLLSYARIGGSVEAEGAIMKSMLDADTAYVGEDFKLDAGEFGAVELQDAHIGGWLLLEDVVITCVLDAYSVEIGGNLFLNNASIGAELDNGSFCKEGGDDGYYSDDESIGTQLSQARIGNDLILSQAMLYRELALESVDIGGDLVLAGSRLSRVSLSGAAVRGALQLIKTNAGDQDAGHPPPDGPDWQDGSFLALSDASVHSIIDSDAAGVWPDSLDLDGFRYQRFVGHSPTEPQRLDRDLMWYKQWLEKDEPYSPQTYQQLSTVLQRIGHEDMADEIRYEGKERERTENANRVDFIWMTLLKVFIGYGYRIEYSFLWLAGIIALGAVVLSVSNQGRVHGMPYGISYSLDMLLPIVELRAYHYSIELSGWARYYFYFHKLMGYVLASFIVAGLSGLTS